MGQGEHGGGRHRRNSRPNRSLGASLVASAMALAIFLAISGAPTRVGGFSPAVLHLKCLAPKDGNWPRRNGLDHLLGRVGRRPDIKRQFEADSAGPYGATFNASVSETLLRRMFDWVQEGTTATSFVHDRASSILATAVDYMQTLADISTVRHVSSCSRSPHHHLAPASLFRRSLSCLGAILLRPKHRTDMRSRHTPIRMSWMSRRWETAPRPHFAPCGRRARPGCFSRMRGRSGRPVTRCVTITLAHMRKCDPSSKLTEIVPRPGADPWA